jgi:diaminohydroxyphosphoribosylaminopyrimidine deaminase/5-amino-6-(5-phosphoribosylamino)uracil reductase
MDDSAARDARYMRRALELAEKGWGQTAPNPMVGAVVVRDDDVVGEGFHARYGEAHAEVNALRAAGDRARTATLYVSLEPCAHVGKTPPCTGAIIEAGIARVVAAIRDPSPIARGGVEALRAAGIEVDVGVERDAALETNASFFNAHASDRPWVVLKLAMSADGAIADLTGMHRWITGPEARVEVHRMRANADAVAVGVGTVLADDPSLTVRDAAPPRVAPRRVVFDSRLRTPVAATVVRTAAEAPTMFVASRGAPGRPSSGPRARGRRDHRGHRPSGRARVAAESGNQVVVLRGGAPGSPARCWPPRSWTALLSFNHRCSSVRTSSARSSSRRGDSRSGCRDCAWSHGAGLATMS